MKTFINKTIITLFIFSIGLISVVFLIHYTMNRTSDFNISEEKKYLIMGHSHPECAFNDELITNSINVSTSGESYFFTYQKVKELIPNNKIDAVFVEYSNNLIDKEMDEWIWGYEKMNAYFPWHSSFMGKEDLQYLYEKNPDNFPNAVSTSTRNNLTRIVSRNFITTKRGYGGYVKLERSNIPRLLEERNATSNDSIKPVEISFENISFLEKIVDYCKSNNVKVYLVRSPQHKYFPKENEKELFSIKKEKFENLDFLDFDNFPFKDNKYGDFGHLNYKGAEIFSKWFNELIDNGLLSAEDKTAFINKEMSKLQIQ